MELRKFTCPEIVFGEGSRNLVGQYVHILVVDQLKGSIEINSEENQGTVVSIRFPKQIE